MKPNPIGQDNGWIPFSLTWTYKKRWYERFMFWRTKIKSPTAMYKQVGKKVLLRIPVNPEGGTKVVLSAPNRAKGDTITVEGSYEVEVTE